MVDLHDIDDYQVEPEDLLLLTAQADAILVIEGRGRIGRNNVLHIPGATTNLIHTFHCLQSMSNRVGIR